MADECSDIATSSTEFVLRGPERRVPAGESGQARQGHETDASSDREPPGLGVLPVGEQDGHRSGDQHRDEVADGAEQGAEDPIEPVADRSKCAEPHGQHGQQSKGSKAHGRKVYGVGRKDSGL